MMSGYLILSSPKTGDVTVLWKKRLPRLLVPLLMWTLVAIAWQMHLEDGITVQNFAAKLLAALSAPASLHLWYLYALAGLYVLSPILAGGLNSLDKTGRRFFLGLILVIECKAMVQTLLPDQWDGWLAIDLIDRLNFFGGNLAVFVLGWYLGNWKKNPPKALLLSLTAATLAVIIAGTWYCKTHMGYYDQRFHNQGEGFMILLAALLFLLAKQGCSRPVPGLAASLVPLTMGIYLMQSLLLELLLALGLTLGTFWDTLWITPCVLIVCWLTIKTLASIRPLCYLFTGMPYAEACRTCNWQYTLAKRK